MLGTVFLMNSSVVAQTVSENNSDAANIKQQPWSVSCAARDDEEQLHCSMVQALHDRSSGQRIFSLSIISQPDSDEKLLRLQLPHGIILPNGVEVKIDDNQPVNLPINWGDQNGSYSEFDLNKEWLNAMRSGNLMKLTVIARNKQRVELQLSLKGFTKAFQKI